MNFKKDHLGFGILLGVLLPVIVHTILFFGLSLFDQQYILKKSTMELTAIVLTVPVFRYYMVNLKAERTGQGMMLVIFAYAIYYMVAHFDILA